MDGPGALSRRGFIWRAGATLGLVGTGGCVGDLAPPAETAGGAGSASADPGTATGSPGADDASATPVHAGYDTTRVAARTPGGETLGAVTAAIAHTPELRYRGLSDTASLPEDRGMLFAFPDVGERTFVMRGMAFGIDIVYADADGTITRVHHAPAPGPGEEGTDRRYPGRGQYVLEVNLGWTTRHGVSEGDVLAFELSGVSPR